MKRYLICMITAFIGFSFFSISAKTADVEHKNDSGLKLKVKPYIGGGLFIPKERDIDIAPMTIYGFLFADETAKEYGFIDIGFSQSGISDTVLWTKGDVRESVVRAGFKKSFSINSRWKYGGDIQSQRMKFGTKAISTQTFGTLLEYRIAKRWSAQFESSQKRNKNKIRFGSFQAIVIREF